MCSSVSTRDTHLLCRQMEALNRRLQRLDKELEDLAPQLEEARAAYVEASGSSKEAAMREMWQRMANVKDTLLQQRQSLYDKLGGAGVTTFLDLVKRSSEGRWV